MPADKITLRKIENADKGGETIQLMKQCKRFVDTVQLFEVFGTEEISLNDRFLGFCVEEAENEKKLYTIWQGLDGSNFARYLCLNLVVTKEPVQIIKGKLTFNEGATELDVLDGISFIQFAFEQVNLIPGGPLDLDSKTEYYFGISNILDRHLEAAGCIF